MIEEKKAVVRPGHRGVVPREEAPDVAPDVAGEKIYIPDYVMQDFGLHKRTRFGGPPAPAPVPDGRESA